MGELKKKIRIALTKGRIEEKAVELLEKIGYDVTELRNKGRRLILTVPNENIEVVLAKAADVITYVEHGVCDLGIVGKDTIMEHGGKFFEVADLGFGKCKFALAVKNGTDFYKGYGVKTVATKYPEVTRSYFEKRGIDVDIVKIEGSVELAPLVGLADGIVDIVETGTTLRENGLSVVEPVAPISARLIVNTVSIKLKQERVSEIVGLIEGAIKNDQNN